MKHLTMEEDEMDRWPMKTARGAHRGLERLGDRRGDPEEPPRPEAERTAVYETRDVNLAAFLDSQGYEFLSLRREGPLCTFTFRDRPQRRDDCLAFYNGHGVVVPMRLVASIRRMKGLLHGRML